MSRPVSGSVPRLCSPSSHGKRALLSHGIVFLSQASSASGDNLRSLFDAADLVIVFSPSSSPRDDALLETPPHVHAPYSPSASSSKLAAKRDSVHPERSAATAPPACCTRDTWYSVVQVLAYGGFPVLVTTCDDLLRSTSEPVPCRQSPPGRDSNEGERERAAADADCWRHQHELCQQPGVSGRYETLGTGSGYPDLEVGTDFLAVGLEQLVVRQSSQACPRMTGA